MLDIIKIKTVTGDFKETAALVTDDGYFAVLVADGSVHVFHVNSGVRISTEDGFATLMGAFTFIDMIYPIAPWADKTVGLNQSEVDMMIAAYHEARERESAQ